MGNKAGTARASRTTGSAGGPIGGWAEQAARGEGCEGDAARARGAGFSSWAGTSGGGGRAGCPGGAGGAVPGRRRGGVGETGQDPASEGVWAVLPVHRIVDRGRGPDARGLSEDVSQPGELRRGAR